MTAPPLLLAGAALLQLPPCVNPLTMAGPSDGYLSLIARYRAGDRESAVSEVVPPDRFLREITALTELLSYHQRHRSCPVRDELEVVTNETAATLTAAAMLHTDRAFQVVEWNDVVARAELALVPLLLELIDDSARRAFEPRWARASAIELSRHGRWDRALGVLDPAVQRYPDDPLVLLARGAVFESRWRMEHDRTIDDDRIRAGPRRARAPSGPREGRALLERAHQDYLQAVTLRKDLPHARVRLGRVLQLLDRTEDSVRELQAVLAADPARTDPRDGYLAHLFLGSAHERAGALDRAAAEYESAVTTLPDGQAAAVALSHALHRNGLGPASREALQSGVARSGRRLEVDPWWPYVAAQTEDPAALFEDLRAEVSR